jgi:hypothetical protein
MKTAANTRLLINSSANSYRKQSSTKYITPQELDEIEINLDSVKDYKILDLDIDWGKNKISSERIQNHKLAEGYEI